jgi:ribosome-binding factor A
MKNRPARVKELIKRELGALIARELTFDGGLVTVHAVDLSADFKHCHVHVGVLGDEREQRAAIGKLHEHRALLQHELAQRVILKFTPQLHFHLDLSVERGTKVIEIMRQLDQEAEHGDQMDAEEPIGDSEELVRHEEAEDAAGASTADGDEEAPVDEPAKPHRAALENDLSRPRGRRAEDAARFAEESDDE